MHTPISTTHFQPRHRTDVFCCLYIIVRVSLLTGLVAGVGSKMELNNILEEEIGGHRHDGVEEEEKNQYSGNEDVREILSG